MENPIDMGEKLMEVASFWRKVVLNDFSGYSPIVCECIFLIVRDLARESMYGQCTSSGEERMTT